ncbi:hypothetical protein ACP70R_033320 [Stipagrostis hirtigluma subsp. patula]
MPPSTTPRPVAAQPDLPDELLEEIFLRLDAAADLARASVACTSFRRIVTGRRFLRRFRYLHPPPILGILDFSDSRREFYQAQQPRSAALAARAVAQAADFTFPFLPEPNRWRVRDARDGRVLLARTTTSWTIFDMFVVCDPLHGRHVQIPPIPGDLASCKAYCGIPYFEPFLVPVGKGEEEASLQVICNVVSQEELLTFVFSSATGQWCGVTSSNIVTHRWMKYYTTQLRASTGHSMVRESRTCLTRAR